MHSQHYVENQLLISLSVCVTAFPASSYFYLKPGKQDVTLTSFMADVSKLTSFPFVRTCKTDSLESTENLAMICSQLREISQKNERGGGNSPPVSRGLIAYFN